MSVSEISLRSCSSPHYEEFLALYAASFPLFEQRTADQQSIAFESPAYHLSLYYEGEVFVGFISYWQFDQYRYIEHFAVHQMHRGRGLGALLLTRFVEAIQSPVILEIDPIVDEVSAARWRFYERCGFFLNNFKHLHPPYREGFSGHSLLILSSGSLIGKDLYESFDADLRNVVMDFTK